MHSEAQFWWQSAANLATLLFPLLAPLCDWEPFRMRSNRRTLAVETYSCCVFGRPICTLGKNLATLLRNMRPTKSQILGGK